jgi:hypothetical protein
VFQTAMLQSSLFVDERDQALYDFPEKLNALFVQKT